MQISVIIPTYKRPDLLKEALESVFAQTFAPTEILIGDDSPDDRTAETIAEISKTSPIPIRYFHHNPRRDQGGNVEFLINAVTTSHLCLLHDDDLLLPDALEVLSKPFADHPDLTASYGKPRLINEDGSAADPAKELHRNSAYFRDSQHGGLQAEPLIMAAVQQISNDAYLVRTDAAKQVGYDHYDQWGEGIDHGFGIRLMELPRASSYYCDHFVAAYREGQDASSTKPNHCGLYRSFKMTMEDPRIDKSHPLVIKWARGRVTFAILEAARTGEIADGWRYFLGRYFRHKWLSYEGAHRLKWLVVASFYKLLLHRNLVELKS